MLPVPTESMLYQGRTYVYFRGRKEGGRNRILTRLVGVGIVVPPSPTDVGGLPGWGCEEHGLERDHLIVALLR